MSGQNPQESLPATIPPNVLPTIQLDVLDPNTVGLFLLAGTEEDQPRNRQRIQIIWNGIGVSRPTIMRLAKITDDMARSILRTNKAKDPAMVLMNINDEASAKIALLLSFECGVIANINVVRTDVAIREKFQDLMGPDFEQSLFTYQLI